MATQRLLQAMQQAWRTLLLYPDDSRLGQDAVQQFVVRAREVLRAGAVQFVVDEDQLVLDTGHGILRQPAGDLLRYFHDAGVAALALDAGTGDRVLTDLMHDLHRRSSHAQHGADPLAVTSWDRDYDGVLLQLRPLCAGLLPSKAEIDLTELVRTDPSTPERLRTAVERERSVNLPIQLAHLLLEDLATVEPSDPYYRAGVRTLLRIQAILVERADISAVDWLLDELDRHASIDELDRRAIKDALGESLTPQWFARLRGASDPTQRALAALVLRMPPAAVGPLLEAIALDEFPVLRAMTAAFID